MPLGKKVGLDASDIALDGDAAPLQKKGQSPQFSIHVYCAQTAGWIKMPLGMKTQATLCYMRTQLLLLKKGTEPPVFGPCLLWRNGRPSQLLLSTCIKLLSVKLDPSV